MAKSLRHRFVSALADSGDATLIQPTNWNADHDFWCTYRSVTGTTDTIAQTDHLGLISYNNASGVAVTLLAPSGGNFGLGWKTKLRNNGAGSVTVTPSSCWINGSTSPIVLAQTEMLELFGTGTTDYAGVVSRRPIALPPALRYDVNQALTQAQQAVTLQNIGFNQFYNLINGKLVESNTGGAVTFEIKTLGGGDPSPTDPVGVVFQNATRAWITAALSITIPSGSTMGATIALPFRLWFAIAEGPVLCVRNCNNGGGMPYGFDPSGILPTSTVIGGTTNAATTYTSASVSPNVQLRPFAYADYNSGLSPAGTWSVSPNRIVMLSPTSPLPGSIVQSRRSTAATLTTTSTTFVNAGFNVALTLTSIINPVALRVDMDSDNSSPSTSGGYGEARINRTPGNVVFGLVQTAYCTFVSDVRTGAWTAGAWDFPVGNLAPTYREQFRAIPSGSTFHCPSSSGSITCHEIML
jgi:hypothetical protein